MKKLKTLYCLLAAILCFSLVFSFAACTRNDVPTEDNQSSEDQSSDDQKQDLEPTEKPLWQEDKALKILAIGNSFSDDTMEYVCQIAKSLGVESVSLGNLYIGGCTLGTHALNASIDYKAYEYRTTTDGKWTTKSHTRMKEALISENWDFVTMQQASGSSGIEETYSDLPYLIEYVTELAPQARLVWNMTWAYQQDSTHPDFKNYENKQTTMYEKIIATVKSQIVTNENFSYIIPNGTAIQNARTSKIGDHLTRDGFHLSVDLGRYIAGLTLVHTLTQLPLNAIEFAPGSLTAEQKQIAIESAENAVKEPFQITKSKY